MLATGTVLVVISIYAIDWYGNSNNFYSMVEMKLVHKITVCVLGSWNKINPFITKCSKIGMFEISLLRWAGSHSNITIYVLRQISLPSLSITNGPSSCIDYSDQPPSKARNEATNSGLMHTGCKALCTAQRSCSAFRGRSAAALIWRLI